MAGVISPDEQDFCLLAEDGRKSSVDNRTIMNTPAPMASSTVLRPTAFMRRLQGDGEIHNSYLSEDLTPKGILTNRTSARNVLLTDSQTKSDSSLQPREINEMKAGADVSGVGSNSSFGLIELDQMSDLSRSMLIMNETGQETSPPAHLLPDDDTPRASKQPDTLESTDCTIQQSTGSCAGLPTVVKPPQRNSTSSTSVQHQAPVRALFHQDDSSQSKPAIQSKLGCENMFALALQRVSSGQLEDDPDMSVHEVKLEDADLEQLDDDFSDIGDFDLTGADDEELSFARSLTLPKRFKQPGLSDCDQSEAQPPEAEITFSALMQEEPNVEDFPDPFPRDDQAEKHQTSTSSEGPNSRAMQQIENISLEWRSENGDKTSASLPQASVCHPLDSMYLRSGEGDSALSGADVSDAIARSSNIFGETTMGGSQLSCRDSEIHFDKSNGGDDHLLNNSKQPPSEKSCDGGTALDVLRGLGLGPSPGDHLSPYTRWMTHNNDLIKQADTQDPHGKTSSTQAHGAVSLSPDNKLATGDLSLRHQRKVRFASITGYLSPASSTSSLHQENGDVQSGKDSDVLISPGDDLAPRVAVYLDDEGRGVTDLAFQCPFPGTTNNPFDCEASPEVDVSQAGFNFDDGKSMDSLGDTDEFLSAEAAIAKLADDEVEFEKENVFVKDAVMEPVESPDSRDSWAIHSTISVGQTSDPWQDSPHLRVSIGTFMRGRTEALGSLDGDQVANRPTFGSSVVRSPQGRALQPLISLEETDIHHDTSPHQGEPDSQKDVGSSSKLPVPTNPGSSPQNSVKTSLIPSSSEEDSPLKAHELDSGQSATAAGRDPGDGREASEPPRQKASHENSIDVSSVAKFITSAACDLNPDELAQTILKMSYQKSTQNTAPTKTIKPDVKVNNATSVNKAFVTSDHVKKAPDKPQKENIKPAALPNNRQKANISKQALHPSNKNSPVDRSNSSVNKRATSQPERLPPSGQQKAKKPARPKSTPPVENKKVSSEMGRSAGSAGAQLQTVNKDSKPSKPTRASSDRAVSSKIPTYLGKSKNTGPVIKATAGKVKSTKTEKDKEPAKTSTDNKGNVSKTSDEGSKALQRERMVTPVDRVSVDGYCDDRKVPSRLSSSSHDSRASSDVAAQWASPRPSSVLTRSLHDRSNSDNIRHNINGSNNSTSDHDGRDRASSNESPDSETDNKATEKYPVTPRDSILPAKVMSRNRMSSTPKKPVGNFSINITSQESLSHIDPSPQTRLTFVEDSPSAIWAQPTPTDTPPDDKPERQSPGIHQPTTDNNAGYFKSTADRDHEKRVPHVESFQHGLFPWVQGKAPHVGSSKPVLLTSQPLSNTAFASQYLPSAATSSTFGRTDTITTVSSFPQHQSGASTYRELTSRGDQRPASLQRDVEPSTHHYAPDVSAPRLDLPTAVQMQEVCCVGLSTQGSIPIHNPNTRWLHATLHIHSLSVDGEEVQSDTGLPFVMKEKVIVEPNSTENVKVIFAPRRAGAYVAQLHVNVSPLVSDMENKLTLPHTLPDMITLHGIAETPIVQLLTEGASKYLDFGELPWSCQKSMPIVLVNRGRCRVPIRLTVSTNNSAHSLFSLEKQTDSSLRSHNTSPGSSKPSLFCMTLPSAQTSADALPKQVHVYFQAPTQRNPQANSLSEFNGTLEIEVDCPTGYHSLGSVSLVAAAGTAKLHTPRTLDVLQLKTKTGSRDSFVFPVRNAGSISLSISLDVTKFPEMFTVEPSLLNIRSGSEAKITVHFEPAHHIVTDRVDSMLLMTVEPEGPGYEMALQGHIVQVPRPTVPLDPSGLYSPTILTNKHNLSWGGVALNKAACQTIVMKHNGDREFKVRLIIYGDTSVFKMKKFIGDRSTLCNAMEVVLQPREEYPIHIYFTPTEVNSYEGRFKVKPTQGPVAYSVPLSGYGGLSQLIIENMHHGLGHNNSYWNKLGPIIPNQTRTINVKVLNKGQRAAYVKVVGFQDLTCKREVSQSIMFADPCEICLKPRKSQVFTVVFNPSTHQSDLCSRKAAIVGNLAFFYGDELARQRLKRFLKTNPDEHCVALAKNNPVNKIDFTKSYLCEGDIHHAVDIKTTPADMELFYLSMSKLTLALIGEPPPPVPPPISNPSSLHPAHSSHPSSFNPAHSAPPTTLEPTFPSQPLSAAYTQPSSRPVGVSDKKLPGVTKLQPAPVSLVRVSEKDTNVAPPGVSWDADSDRKTSYKSGKAIYTTSEKPVKAMSSSSVQPCTDDCDRRWIVKPEQILLTASKQNEEPELKKIEIVNFTQRPLTYDLAIPSHCIIVSPEHGVVQPNGFESICISPSPNLHLKNIQLPWQGSLYIHIDRKIKIIDVQLHEQLPSRALTLTPDLTRASQVPPPTAVTTESKMSHSMSQALSVTSSTLSGSRSSKKNKTLDISPSVLLFSDCDSDRQTLRVKINNRDMVSHQVKVVQPSSPFYVKKSRIDILPLHYVRLPVEFCRPKHTKSGFSQYHSTLVLILETGETFQVNLEAEISP